MWQYTQVQIGWFPWVKLKFYLLNKGPECGLEGQREGNKHQYVSWWMQITYQGKSVQKLAQIQDSARFFFLDNLNQDAS